MDLNALLAKYALCILLGPQNQALGTALVPVETGLGALRQHCEVTVYK